MNLLKKTWKMIVADSESSTLTTEEIARYSRQLILPGFEVEGSYYNIIV